MNGLVRGRDGSSGNGGPGGRCPSRGDWRERLAHRWEMERTEPEGWREDLAHLEHCDSCREITLELDPTLLFRPLAAPTPELDAAAEVASMQQAVAALRRAERVEGRESRSRTGLPWTSWGGRAAAAVVALTALSLGAGVWTDDPSSGRLWDRAPWNASVLSRTLSPEDGGYGEIAGLTATTTGIPGGALLPGRSEALGSVVEDTVDRLPLIEPFEPDPYGDAYGTDAYGTGVGGDPVIWGNDKTDVIWMVDFGEIEGEPQDV